MKRFKRFKRYLSTALTLMMITTSLSFNPVLGAEVVDGTGG